MAGPLFAETGTEVALQMLDMIGSNPFVTPRGAEARLNIAYNTAVRAIGQLEHIKVLSPVGDARRDRALFARAILDILEEPARLKPA